MRLQTNQPPIFIEGRALGHIVYDLELEEFFWCMPPPTHLNLLDRTTAIEEKVFNREQKPGLINRLRTLSHVHSSHRCSNVVATFPDDNNVWFYNIFWFIEQAFYNSNQDIPLCLSWKILEMFHVSDFIPPPKYITIPQHVIKHVLSFIHYKERFLRCSLVSTQFNALVQNSETLAILSGDEYIMVRVKVTVFCLWR